jgi:hypothetical protein
MVTGREKNDLGMISPPERMTEPFRNSRRLISLDPFILHSFNLSRNNEEDYNSTMITDIKSIIKPEYSSGLLTHSIDKIYRYGKIVKLLMDLR